MAAKLGRRRPGSPPRMPLLVPARILMSFRGSAASDGKRCIADPLTRRSITGARLDAPIFAYRSEWPFWCVVKETREPRDGAQYSLLGHLVLGHGVCCERASDHCP